MTGMGILFILIGIDIIQGQSIKPYDVHTVDNTGILFEDVSRVLLYNSEWKIVTTINLDQLNTWDEYVEWRQNIVKEMYEENSKIIGDSKCESEVQDIKYLTKVVKLTLSRFRVKNINKRSIVDGIGKLSKFLFGTMDQEDSDDIYARIEDLENNDKENLKLMKEQVTLVKSNYENTRQTINKLNKDLEESRKVATGILTTLQESLIPDVEKLKTQLKIEQLVKTITIHLQEIEHQINELAIVLAAVSEGHLHPLLLNYNQIRELLQSIPREQNGVLSDSYMLQNLAKVHSMRIKDKIICTITIPMLIKNWYYLKKIYSLPITSNGSMVLHYNFNYDYLVTSQDSDRMMLWVNKDKDTCIEASLWNQPKTKICKLSTPMYLTPNHNCILLLYKGWEEAKQSCETTPILHSEHTITKMVTENKWLFYFKNTTEVDIKCPNFASKIKLANQGVLSLQAGCVAELNDMILTTTYTTAQNLSMIQTNIIPSKTELEKLSNTHQVIEVRNSTHAINFQTHESHVHFLKDKREEYNKILSQIEQTQKNREFQKQHSINKYCTFTLGTITSLLLIVAIIILLYKIKQKYTVQRTTETPKQDTLPPPPFTIALTPQLPQVRRNPIFENNTYQRDFSNNNLNAGLFDTGSEENTHNSTFKNSTFIRFPSPIFPRGKDKVSSFSLNNSEQI